MAVNGANSVTTYSTTGGSGLLTLSGSIAAGGNPSMIALDPLGKFAYVTNNSSNTISMYSIDSNSGQLSGTGGASIATGMSPLGMATVKLR